LGETRKGVLTPWERTRFNEGGGQENPTGLRDSARDSCSDEWNLGMGEIKRELFERVTGGAPEWGEDLRQKGLLLVLRKGSKDI